eukprot:4802829-Alexandrium_andersonii.AAC.1
MAARRQSPAAARGVALIFLKARDWHAPRRKLANHRSVCGNGDARGKAPTSNATPTLTSARGHN